LKVFTSHAGGENARPRRIFKPFGAAEFYSWALPAIKTEYAPYDVQFRKLAALSKRSDIYDEKV